MDAIWIFYAWAGVKTELEGLETDYFAFADLDSVFDFYTPVIIANNTFLAEEPETARAFLDAVSRGYEFAIEHPQEAGEILCKAAPELDPDLVKPARNTWRTSTRRMRPNGDILTRSAGMHITHG